MHTSAHAIAAQPSRLAHRIRITPLLRSLFLASGFYVAASLNPSLVYAQVGSTVGANTLHTGRLGWPRGNATIGTGSNSR
ncbi:MAG: hypothetical protein HC765_09420, partial [Brachymonas sp.]|nr:hypothetical protein [Brachymonas sp.]